MTQLVWRWRSCADPNRPPGHRIAHPLADRFGHPCVLLAQGRNGNRLVEFADGHRVIAPLYATRRAALVEELEAACLEIERMRGGVLAWVIHEAPITAKGDILALIVLANHARADGSNAWPSVRTIAKEGRLSERGARQALRNLEAAGAITATGKSRFGTTVYQVNGPFAPAVVADPLANDDIGIAGTATKSGIGTLGRNRQMVTGGDMGAKRHGPNGGYA
jgi:hypothetical protein